MMLRILSTVFLTLALIVAGVLPSMAQQGGQTLEDIMARQKGETVEPAPGMMTAPTPGTNPLDGQLGPLGATSDAEIFRKFRDGNADMVASSGGELGVVVMQDGGMRWLQFRRGPLPKYGGYMLLTMMAVLLLFYLIRGKIRIDGPVTGQKIPRYTTLERFAHWLMAGSFILLAITGLTSLFGRIAIIPLIGKEAFAPVAMVGKFIHNYVAWAFIVALVMVLLLWISQNFPNRNDLKWLAKGGGLFTKGVHPPAGKFNAGEKIIFWAVIVLGAMITATGLSLLFPYKFIMFAPTFEAMNYLGISQFIGLGELNTALAPQEEMQLSQLWHAVVAFVYMTIIIAHIYLGSVGMEGALESMTKGEVEVQWAKEHHSLWYDDVTNETPKASKQSPAE